MKKKVALLCGGFTGEQVISMQTADTIAAHIDKQRYEVFKIVLSREIWYNEDSQGRRHIVDKNDFSIDSGEGKILFDVAVIAIHGTPGEDGKLQAYLDLLNIPYTTCDVTTSAITMNKFYTKAILRGISGLHLAASEQLFREERGGWMDRCRRMRLPLFVKPNNGGSSIGMSKVSTWGELGPALEKAFAEDEQVLVEEFVKGKEYSIGAFRDRGAVNVLPATEILTGRDFFDFEAKYSPGAAEEITPARLAESDRLQLEEISGNVYRKLNCRGVVRMDFIRESESGDWYFIEVNTVPGQSENSILPRQIRASGRNMTDFYTMLLEEALAGDRPGPRPLHQ